jgi:uncharacterized protein YqgC (DUF456 family)
MATALLWILAALLVLVGLIGIVLPALPGTPVIFLGLLLGAWIDGFEHVSLTTVALLGVLTALAWVLDFAAAALGAQKMGASRQAIAGAAIGTVVGLFFVPVGLFVGPLIGAAAGEYLARRDSLRAAKVGVATSIAVLLAFAAKLAIAIAMIGSFAVAYFVA